MKNQLTKIISLIYELQEYGLTQNQIAEKVSTYTTLDALKNVEKTVISKIINGDKNFKRSQHLIPEWIRVLKCIQQEFNNQNLTFLEGYYIGFYKNIQKQSVRPLSMLIQQDSVVVKGISWNHTGNLKIINELLIIDTYISGKTRPIYMFSNLDDFSLGKKHIEKIIFHSTWKEGKGIISSKDIFFYQNTPSETITEEPSIDFRTKYEKEYLEAETFFKKQHSQIETSKTVFTP